MMNQETYDYVLEILSREPSFNEGIRQLQKRWSTVLESVSEKTLKSIQAQYYVRRMRRNHFHHYSRDTREKYYRLYKDAKAKNEKNVIMRLAAKNDISPCLLARIILEEYYWNDVDHGRVHERSEGRGSLPPGFMTDCIRDIAKLPDPELAKEIYETMVLDNFYGPAVDSIKKSCGVEYEIILKAKCQKAGLSFIDESQMREEGYDKTPDIRLNVPVMINNRVVNWIESKASFGDPINHQQYMIDQYLPYKNRFGPGAVIYWFGFVQELAETGERGILLLNGFPGKEQIVHLKDLHKQEKESLGFLVNKMDKNDNNNCGLCDPEMDSKFSSYVDPMFDSDGEDDQSPGYTTVIQERGIISNVATEGTEDSSEKYKRWMNNELGLMDADVVRSTGYTLCVSQPGNYGDSLRPSCVTFENSDYTNIDSRLPKSNGDDSVCFNQNKSNEFTTNIVSPSDNRQSSHRDILCCEGVNEHWNNSEATKPFCVDTNISGFQNIHLSEVNANKVCDSQDNSIPVYSRSVAQSWCVKPCSAGHSVDHVENVLLSNSTTSESSTNNSPLSHDREINNKSLSFIYSDKRNKKRKPKRGER